MGMNGGTDQMPAHEALKRGRSSQSPGLDPSTHLFSSPSSWLRFSFCTGENSDGVVGNEARRGTYL